MVTTPGKDSYDPVEVVDFPFWFGSSVRVVVKFSNWGVMCYRDVVKREGTTTGSDRLSLTFVDRLETVPS